MPLSGGEVEGGRTEKWNLGTGGRCKFAEIPATRPIRIQIDSQSQLARLIFEIDLQWLHKENSPSATTLTRCAKLFWTIAYLKYCCTVQFPICLRQSGLLAPVLNVQFLRQCASPALSILPIYRYLLADWVLLLCYYYRSTFTLGGTHYFPLPACLLKSFCVIHCK